MKLRTLLAGLVMTLATVTAHAIELRISAQALERTLQQQLFNAPDGRYYLRGSRTSACYVYVDQPKVSFKDDRVVVTVHSSSRLGAGMFGRCVGVGFSTVADVSVIPNAENETIGFRDAKIERFTGNRELDFLVVPFLSRKLPDEMKVNAATLLRDMLKNSQQQTGYSINLDALRIHSMQVDKDVLVVDLDGSLSVK